jgi:hypothetical protein
MQSVLTEHDRQGDPWLKIKKHFESRLAVLRQKNDKPATEAQTAVLRGRIAEVKAILALGEEQQTNPSEENLFQV